MVQVGFHVSIAGSIDKAVDRAVAAGCDTFQIFSRNPRGWRMKELSEPAVEKFIEKVKRSGIYPPVDHMPYLPNLASPDEHIYRKSLDALIHELGRCEALEIPFLVTHLGSHRGSGLANGYQRIADAINRAFTEVENDVILLLENTAGTKNSVGGFFEDIRAIMDRVDNIERIGICFDTCHAFVAGYEIRTKESLKATLEHFDAVVGLEKLKLIHLNDAKGDLGSKLDRHEHIGLGYIGEEGFRVILQNPHLKNLPMILETPVDERCDDLGNIRKVRELAD
ncbi:MAG: deoxyribonuclease IV [Candidatus Syntropharchaeales archaeon]